jgi:hypothetical protein
MAALAVDGDRPSHDEVLGLRDVQSGPIPVDKARSDRNRLSNNAASNKLNTQFLCFGLYGDAICKVPCPNSSLDDRPNDIRPSGHRAGVSSDFVKRYWI